MTSLTQKNSRNLQNKEFYANLEIKKNYEFCPVFEQPSIFQIKNLIVIQVLGKINYLI